MFKIQTKEKVPQAVLVKLPASLHARLKSLAMENGTSMQAIIVEAIIYALDDMKKRT